MKVKCSRVRGMLVGIISSLLFLTGCTNHNVEYDDNIKNANDGLNARSAIELSEGATLSGFYMSHQGMAMEPYYILRVTADDCFMKITNEEPTGYRMTEDGDEPPKIGGEGSLDSEREKKYFGFVNTIKDCEHASLIAADKTIVEELENIVLEEGVLNWDNYTKSKSEFGVQDSGDSYDLFVLFSDGTTVTVDSYNSCPKGWDNFFGKVRDLFEENADYSQYRIQELSEKNCVRMIVEFNDGNLSPTNDFKVDICVDEDMRTWTWAVRLKDSEGRYLPKGTDISDYREESLDTLNYGRLIEVLKAHDVQDWDGISGTLPEGNKYMTVLIADKDDKTIDANGNNIPKDYDIVRDDFIKALIEFYEMKVGNL